MIDSAFTRVLNGNPYRQRLVHHPFFDAVDSSDLTREAVASVVGQWWHPLHYFPTFLARSVAVLPSLSMKTAISKILYQELGEGDPSNAHETLYVATMVAAGFTEAEITRTPASQATCQLVALYETTSAERLSALGAVYGTEVADLAMVSGIGNAVRRLTGIRDLPWVDIHIRQEPDHVRQAGEALEPEFSVREEDEILLHAERMWQCWIRFFDVLHEHATIAERTLSTAAV